VNIRDNQVLINYVLHSLGGATKFFEFKYLELEIFELKYLELGMCQEAVDRCVPLRVA